MQKLIIPLAVCIGGFCPQVVFSEDVFSKESICRGAYFAITSTTSSLDTEKLNEEDCKIADNRIVFGKTHLYDDIFYELKDEYLSINIRRGSKAEKIFFSKNDILNTFKIDPDVRSVEWGMPKNIVIAIEKRENPRMYPVSINENSIRYFTEIFNYNCDMTYEFHDNKLFLLTYRIDTKNEWNSKELFTILFNKMAKKYTEKNDNPAYEREHSPYMLYKFTDKHTQISVCFGTNYVTINYHNTIIAQKIIEEEYDKKLQEQNRRKELIEKELGIF